MVEIIPITSTTPIIKPRRIVREDEQRKDKKQQPQHENDESKQESGDELVQHIDEIV